MANEENASAVSGLLIPRNTKKTILPAFQRKNRFFVVGLRGFEEVA